ncbi:MAG: LPXTG cell wall anchor domain-containing protein [Streptococcus sp.]|nr:MAG: LPXTG cell wall anchor domain-containing protein [Streptococcus sp.]
MKKGIKLSVVGLTAVAGLLISTNVLASEVTKDGNQIQVTEPEITYSSEAAETYVNKDLTYHTEIPDEVEINEGDTLTYTLPEQLQWTTTQEFDVTSPEGEVVGRAVASNDSQNVTTTFNGYFKEHPLDKQFDMTLSTMWKKEVVKEGQKYDLSFNGTVVQQAEVKPQGKANPTEIVAKWGWQDKDDPSLIQWGGRVNFVKHDLHDVNVSDTWDDNNEYVEGSMRLFELSSAEPWVGIREIPLTEANVQFYKNGFKFNLPHVTNIVSVEYKTRLKNKLQNPVNVLRFTASGQEYSFEREIVVANAKGSAKGTIRPYSWDVPPAPVYDIPEYTGDAVPLDPPVNEKPELDILGIPEMPPAPVHELPEWQGGTTPLDPPTVDKPEWNGGVVPNVPPVLDLPELVVPEEPKSLEKEPPAPSAKEERKNATDSKLEVSANELPKTGEVSNVFLSIFGISLLISGAMIWQDNKKK